MSTFINIVKQKDDGHNGDYLLDSIVMWHSLFPNYMEGHSVRVVSSGEGEDGRVNEWVIKKVIYTSGSEIELQVVPSTEE